MGGAWRLRVVRVAVSQGRFPSIHLGKPTNVKRENKGHIFKDLIGFGQNAEVN